ncbi:Cellulose synthase-like protein H1 [Vitis vinifera]|uniref:Cellulose synthase-like protein H1 n=1 Tax=Vitis vinifera TaxID=29760 RepID=A0A438DTQ0_VITVI|nr:Cellulose synthase-like protein H1 [Vitis vinifera]
MRINNTSTKAKIWKTSDNIVIESIHPPEAKIEKNINGTIVTASPFKTKPEDKGTASASDIRRIMEQINYTNMFLITLGNQVSRVEEIIETQDHLKKPFVKNDNKPLFKPFELSKKFQENPQIDQAFIDRISQKDYINRVGFYHSSPKKEDFEEVLESSQDNSDKINAYLNTISAALNCLQEGLVPTQFYEKTRQALFSANDLKEKVLLGVPFLSSIFPLWVDDQEDLMTGIRSNEIPHVLRVILENKESRSDGLPHLVYVSREKHPKHPHHYKAGAMNVLTRVSGAMTNAPFMLNVDCDMYANNPQIFHHSMCLLLGSKNEQDCGFVQTPQSFYDGLKDDPFGNQFGVLYKYVASGIAGLQGPHYSGTGCFHRRKVIYGLWPDGRMEFKGRIGKLTDERLEKTFGNSKEFTKTAARILSGLSGVSDCPYDLSNRVEAAHQIASCSYEYGANWGTKIGWLYGTTTEDILTGMRIHARGWKSTDCRPDPPAFLGCAPSGGPAALIQQKRWATGLLEVLFSKNSPFIITFTAKLQFRQCLAYMWILSWGLRPIPEPYYLALPAYCIMAGSHFLPNVQDPAVLIPISLFVSYNFHTLLEYWGAGYSIRACWNNLRMWRITAVTAWLFGFLSVILKLLGLSETVFEVTKKDQSTTPGEGSDKDAGRFTFDGSLIFVPATTLLLVHLMALVTALLGLFDHVEIESRIGEIICSVWVVLCFSPFLKGLFGKENMGYPNPLYASQQLWRFFFLLALLQ